MDKATLFKKLNDAIRADKDLDFLYIKNLEVYYKRSEPARCPDGVTGPLPPIEVNVVVCFHSNERLEG